MSRSKNPLPKEFLATVQETHWDGTKRCTPCRVRSVNGWYQILVYRPNGGYWAQWYSSMRWYDIQARIESGWLVPDYLYTDEEIEIEELNLESVI